MPLNRLLSPFREFGFGVGLLYVLDRALRQFSSRASLHLYEFVAQPVPAGPLLPAAYRQQIRWSEVGPGSPEIGLMPRPAEVIEARFRQGAVCIAVRRKEQFIGYVWFCAERYHEDEVRCVYRLVSPRTTVFDFDFFLFPEHRLGRAFAAVWDAANEHLRSRGIEHTLSRISRFNLASRQAHARLNTRVLGQALFLRWGRWQACFSRRLSPAWLQLSLDGEAELRV